jgi:hypothetical protein
MYIISRVIPRQTTRGDRNSAYATRRRLRLSEAGRRRWSLKVKAYIFASFLSLPKCGRITPPGYRTQTKPRDFTGKIDLDFVSESHSIMDVHSIANLFATSLNPDPNVRKAGEIEIRRVRPRVYCVRGFLWMHAYFSPRLAAMKVFSAPSYKLLEMKQLTRMSSRAFQFSQLTM